MVSSNPRQEATPQPDEMGHLYLRVRRGERVEVGGAILIVERTSPSQARLLIIAPKSLRVVGPKERA